MKFDIIVGNPPFNRGFVSKTFSDYVGKNREGYIAFIIKSLEILKNDGYLTFVVPSTFLISKSNSKFMNYLTNRYNFGKINFLSNKQQEEFEASPNKMIYFLIKNNNNYENTAVVSSNKIEYNIKFKRKLYF